MNERTEFMHIATVMYRNPVEEWFWESGLAYWLILSGLAAFLLVAAYLWVGDLIKKYRTKRRKAAWAARTDSSIKS